MAFDDNLLLSKDSIANHALNLQHAKVLVRPSYGDITTYVAISYKGGIGYQGTSAADAINAAIDYAAIQGGGSVLLSSDTFYVDKPIYGQSVATGPSFSDSDKAPVWIRGDGDLFTPPFGAGRAAGTVIKWAGGTGDGSVLDLSDDCHGYRVSNLVVDANLEQKYCIHVAGAHVRLHDMHAVRPREGAGANAGACIRVTNGPTEEQDRYAGVKIHTTTVRGGDKSFCWGIVVENIHNPSDPLTNYIGCSDGGISDVRVLGCDAGQIKISAGGWMMSGENHFTSTKNCENGVVLDSEAHLTGAMYFDVVGQKESLTINNNMTSVVGCKFVTDNKIEGQHAIVVNAEKYIVITGCTFTRVKATANEVVNIVHFTKPATDCAITGNVAKAGIASNGFCNKVTDPNNRFYVENNGAA